MNERVLRFRPPRIALALIGIASTVHFVGPANAIVVLASPVAAAATVVSGFLIMILAWLQFRRQVTPVCPTDTPTALITDGVYRLTRNPMYLGIFAMLVAVAMFVGTFPFYVSALVFLLVVDRHFCPYEERRLAALFDERFRAYELRVRRWL